MGENSAIEWTDHTINPWHGCHKVSPGCDNCYMYRDKKRFGQEPAKVVRAVNNTFSKPLQWEKPAKVFVCSWSDFFIEEADEWRGEFWEVIRRTPHLTYQLLTKRPENIAARLPDDWGSGWPNVWLGVTAENQEMADKRIPLLLQTAAVLRFVSVEPMLGPVDLGDIKFDKYTRMDVLEGCGISKRSPAQSIPNAFCNHLDWVICGGESGPGARPMHPDWARSLRDQCQTAKVPFFFKQWGEFQQCDYTGKDFGASYVDAQCIDGDLWDLDKCDENGQLYSIGYHPECPKCKGAGFVRVGKKAAGCSLNGREYKEFPTA